MKNLILAILISVSGMVTAGEAMIFECGDEYESCDSKFLRDYALNKGYEQNQSKEVYFMLNASNSVIKYTVVNVQDLDSGIRFTRVIGPMAVDGEVSDAIIDYYSSQKDFWTDQFDLPNGGYLHFQQFGSTLGVPYYYFQGSNLEAIAQNGLSSIVNNGTCEEIAADIVQSLGGTNHLEDQAPGYLSNLTYSLGGAFRVFTGNVSASQPHLQGPYHNLTILFSDHNNSNPTWDFGMTFSINPYTSDVKFVSATDSGGNAVPINEKCDIDESMLPQELTLDYSDWVWTYIAARFNLSIIQSNEESDEGKVTITRYHPE
jgi:hypothetical protein